MQWATTIKSLDWIHFSRTGLLSSSKTKFKNDKYKAANKHFQSLSNFKLQTAMLPEVFSYCRLCMPTHLLFLVLYQIITLSTGIKQGDHYS